MNLSRKSLNSKSVLLFYRQMRLFKPHFLFDIELNRLKPPIDFSPSKVGFSSLARDNVTCNRLTLMDNRA